MTELAEVLFVDDDPGTLETLGDVLHEKGYRIDIEGTEGAGTVVTISLPREPWTA